KLQSYLVFAKEIAERIGSARNRGSFDRLVVVAAPRFLGILRPALVSAGIDPDRSIDKEMTGRPAAEIQEMIDAE
ncbi:MAG: host attachment protein, partial [Woeseiaceae bacterium]